MPWVVQPLDDVSLDAASHGTSLPSDTGQRVMLTTKYRPFWHLRK
jgi:hypothetical protein